MNTLSIVTISVVSGVLCLILILSFVFKSVRKKLEIYIDERFDKSEIIGATTGANFFGEKSKGGKQIRGNGALVLTQDQLAFIRAMPLKEYIIPINSIKQVSMPKSFNGKSMFSKLLCVHYIIDGTEDSSAWAIKNPTKWKESIETLIQSDKYTKIDHESETIQDLILSNLGHARGSNDEQTSILRITQNI